MPQPRPTPSAPEHEIIDPRWLLKAIAWVIVAALICGYLTLCLLFYQGQWQLILHPTLGGPPLPNPVRFDATETGTPRLSGFLLAAPESSPYRTYTVLYLRGGDSSLTQSPTDLQNLANLNLSGLNLFAFDYRGYGQSDPIHPNHLRMTEDAAAAFRYLTETRAVPESQIILYGSGLGCSLATYLAAAHPGIPALILNSPGPDPLSTALADPRTRALPVRFLFHEDFALTPLATLPTSKLLLSSTDAIPEAFTTAAPSKTLKVSPPEATEQALPLGRFLDQTLLHAPTAVKE